MEHEHMPRWISVAIVLVALSVFINYVDRGNLSTAAPLIKGEFHISATVLGLLLTSFFVTYALMNFVVGWLIDRFYVSPVLLTGYVLWSLATALTGIAQTLAALFALRLLLGAAESVAFPAYSKIFAKCLPQSRLGAANGATLAAMSCGPAFGIFAGGLVIAAFGWRLFFVAFGALSVLWVLPWLAYVHKNLCAGQSSSSAPVPNLRSILRERSLWGASIAHFCGLYLFYFILTWIPYYLVNERHNSMVQMAMIGGAAYLVQALAMISTGWAADRLIVSGASPTIVRKTLLAFGGFTAGTFALLCAISGPALSTIYLMIACAGLGMVGPNVWAIMQTLAGPHAAGRWAGIQNGIGNIAGIVAPAITGMLVDRTGYFILPFTVAAILAFASAFIWLFVVGPVVPIDWSRRISPAPVPA